MFSYVPPALAGAVIAPFVPSGYLIGYGVLVTAGLLSVALLGRALRPVAL